MGTARVYSYNDSMERYWKISLLLLFKFFHSNESKLCSTISACSITEICTNVYSFKMARFLYKYYKFSELSTRGKVKRVTIGVVKFALLIGLIYLFICSLTFLSSAFRLLGGKTAGEVFSSDSLLVNPLAALVIGILVTVVFQSSSTTTSIVVAMVSSGSKYQNKYIKNTVNTSVSNLWCHTGIS